ncbi:hypothetical protein LXA43DRAFT_195049 [Ganoderma leucocontextum]|nr:hypothetical protein LXA43DRAFT_195049 [Ganoderma leucocontextum]
MPLAGDRQHLIVADVQRAIDGINSIIICLQRDAPLSSNDLAIDYPQSTVDEYLRLSQTVEESLRSASTTASDWLKETGDNLSHNLNEVRRIEGTIHETSVALKEAEAHTRATEASIRTLEADIQHEQSNLRSAQQARDRAKRELEKAEKKREALKIAAIATIFFPIVAISLAIADATAMRAEVEGHQRAVSASEAQLSVSRSQLEARRRELAGKRDERDRLSSRVGQLSREAHDLSAKAGKLKAEQATLAELSVRINDCLYTVNRAVGSSTTVSSGSMHGVVSGIRGVVEALGSEDMFAGPLVQLDDAGLDTLDRRMEAIRLRMLPTTLLLE